MCRVRFPFTFMGVVSLAFGAWVIAYVTAFHRPADAFTEALEAIAGVLSIGLGIYLLLRRLRRGREA